MKEDQIEFIKEVDVGHDQAAVTLVKDVETEEEYKLVFSPDQHGAVISVDGMEGYIVLDLSDYYRGWSFTDSTYKGIAILLP